MSTPDDTVSESARNAYGALRRWAWHETHSHNVVRAGIAVASTGYMFVRVLHRTQSVGAAIGAALVVPFVAYGVFGAWTELASAIAEREWAIWMRDRRSALPLLGALAAGLVYVGATLALWIAIRLATTK